MTDSRVVTIEKDRILVEDSNKERHSIKADSVIVATGSEPDTSLIEPLKERFSEVYIVGDAQGPGNVGSTLRTAAMVALRV